MRFFGMRKSQSMTGISKTFIDLKVSKQTSGTSKLNIPTDSISQEYNEQEQYQNKVIRIGVCCREKKMKSRPMQKILGWLAKVP